ncbi:MAG: glycosyltransferase family 1 protein [Bacteroidales bacterium]|nr:glycosyltransferase family 1 protein [Bacteroidales bacterium]
MKIAIEAQRVFREKKHGMDIYALELIRNLQEIDHKNEYVIFVKPDVDDSVLKETSNFKIVKLDGGFYPFWEQYALPRAAKEAGCQILHCTSNTAPVSCKIPMVITLHDIIYMESSYAGILSGSATPYQKFGNIYRKLLVPRLVNKSLKNITVSHSEKNRIDKFFGLTGDKQINVVYNGVGVHFKPVTDKMELLQAKEKYHLPENFFFFLGNTDPKKNVKRTLTAFSDFLQRTGLNYYLVMADYEQDKLQKLLDEIDNKSLINRIILAGYIPNDRLPSIYSQSKVFLYPSLRESFGIPMLEAMSCGVPVLSSNTESMPEIAGNAACLINPFKAEEITEAMIKLVNDEQLRKSLVRKGFERVSDFSWKITAQSVLEQYREIGAE